jgi:organic hydroperoxide reductase OsmC/OhrA
MRPYPHVYTAGASASATGMVPVASVGLPDIESAPPPEFDGPGGVWSPETLLVASIANCFILTFRGVSRAAKFDWAHVACQVDGVLERVSGVTQFTRFTTRATLSVNPGVDHAKARELLERAEKVCLVANSLRGERLIELEVIEEATE